MATSGGGFFSPKLHLAEAKFNVIEALTAFVALGLALLRFKANLADLLFFS